MLDAEGKEHLLMRFYVEGPANEGIAHLEMVKDQRNKWEYKYLFVDIPGKQNEKKKMPQNRLSFSYVLYSSVDAYAVISAFVHLRICSFAFLIKKIFFSLFL